jgi:putative flippase GtrA
MVQQSNSEFDVCTAEPPSFSSSLSSIGLENERSGFLRSMMPRGLLPYWPLFLEFSRYVLVGGGAFIVDISVLQLSLSYLFHDLATTDDLAINGILLATAFGFIAGLICNYIFSCLFVFKRIAEDAKQHKIRSFVLFTIIGIIGLGLTELLMYLGILLVGQDRYLAIKIFAAGVVLMWNYLARKILIFKGVEWKTDINTP